MISSFACLGSMCRGSCAEMYVQNTPCLMDIDIDIDIDTSTEIGTENAQCSPIVIPLFTVFIRLLKLYRPNGQIIDDYLYTLLIPSYPYLSFSPPFLPQGY
jgi:hypothetical protein